MHTEIFFHDSAPFHWHLEERVIGSVSVRGSVRVAGWDSVGLSVTRRVHVKLMLDL